MATVREFIHGCYRLINASNPTIPLHGDDLKLGIEVMNQLLDSYAATGLMLTIARTVTIPINVGLTEVVVGPPSFVPLPDIAIGRLANFDSAWLTLDGVTYPLIDETRNNYLGAFKYEPLQGLPRFIIAFPETDVVRLRLYPAPSQFYEFSLRGKFQLTGLTSNDTMDVLPGYYLRYLKYATAKDISMETGRADAWTDKLEQILQKSEDVMVASSEVNVAVTGEKDSLLNGAWRVRAGV